MRANASRVLRTVARVLVWQLPEQPYPSSHPTDTRRAPRAMRA